MSDPPTETSPQAVVPRWRRGLWDGVVPEAFGLAYVVVILAALAGGYVFTDYLGRAQFRATCQLETTAVAELLAAGLGALPPDDPAAVAAFLQNIAPRTALLALRWVAPDGTPRATWPDEAARQGLPVPGTPPVAARSAAPHTPPLTATAEVRRVNGEPAGQVQIARALATTAFDRSALLWPWSLVSGVVLLTFAIFYRRLRRHLRPVAAIERSLESYGAGLERELLTLSLSDSLGAAARGWNQLVQQLTDTQRLVQEGGPGAPGSGSGEVLARYENTVFRTLVDGLPFGVLRVGLDSGIAYANASAAALLGRVTNDLVGQKLIDRIDSGAVTQALAAVQARPRGELTVDHSRQDGEHEFTLRFRIMPVAEPSASGDVLVTIEDISQLREGQRARDNFLYHVTHELRTPLTNIHAYAETLTRPDFDDEQTRKECYNVLISETQRLSRLVEDILSISQLEVGTARFEVGELDLARLMRQMVQDNLGAADGKHIDLALALPPKVPKIQGDKQRLAVLLNNLVGNAIKYTPENGKVQVKLEVRDQRALIEVADTGIGIAPKDQPHVFEKFYRAADESVQMIPGTGLGLALAREVARLHGGDIFLRSELGKGSIFTLELPLASAERTEVATR